MSTTKNKQATKSYTGEELKALLSNALKKIGSKEENRLCRYLPGDKGGYMHHFTLKKLKKESPNELVSMLNEYVLENNNPKELPPKPRASRGTRRRRDHISFTKSELDRMLTHAKAAGDKDIIRKLIPMKDLRTIKKDLIASIRHNSVEEDLWQSYVELVHETGKGSESEASAFSQFASNFNFTNPNNN